MKTEVTQTGGIWFRELQHGVPNKYFSFKNYPDNTFLMFSPQNIVNEWMEMLIKLTESFYHVSQIKPSHCTLQIYIISIEHLKQLYQSIKKRVLAG